MLLDTHIWIWSLMDPLRLGSRLRRTLTAADTQLWLSPISAWEAGLLIGKARLRVQGSAEDWVATALERVPMQEAPLTHEIALASLSLTLPHPDPADRFLVATALHLELHLATADQRLLDAAPCPLIANT